MPGIFLCDVVLKDCQEAWHHRSADPLVCADDIMLDDNTMRKAVQRPAKLPPDGDELIVHPSKPERVFVLPRNRDEIYVAGGGLPQAMEWLCSSGTLTEAFDERNFELFDTRRAAE